jgi:hypothetical protein
VDEFLRKKILYFLKHEFDGDPYKIIELAGQFGVEINVLERNVLYLAQRGLIRHHDSQGHDHVLAEITAEGIAFVENDYKENHELNILEFMRDRIGKKGGLSPTDFPEYLFPDRERLTSRLLRYDHTEVADIHHSDRKRGIDLIVPKPGLIAHLEDLRKEQESRDFLRQGSSSIVNIAMGGSQIQQGTIGSTQQGEFNIGNQEGLLKFLEELKRNLPELDLAQDDKSEIQADMSTIEAQLESSRPKKGIISESLGSIRRILEGAGGSLMAGSLLKALSALLT